MSASEKPFDQRAPNMTAINQMSSVEIRENIAAIKVAQMNLIGRKERKGSIDHPMQIRQNRRTLARMITVLVKRGERVV